MKYRYTLPTNRLEQQFADAKPLYSHTEALIEANRCLFCYDAPCVQACPADVAIPDFIHKIKSGNIRGAAKTIFQTNPLGVSTARVCPVEESCAGACVLNEQNGKPVQIGRLQRYATESGLARADRLKSPLFTPLPPTGKKVALVGSGPASLSCAATLALGGVKAVIFERDDLPGGLNTTGIAPYKIDMPGALNEIEQLAGQGIDINTGVEIGSDLTIADLLTDHEAVFLGPGLGEDKFPGIEGEKPEGVWGATRLIRKIKNEPDFTLPESLTRVLVIGGGNTAIDIARELAQLGVAEVEIIYRRSEQEMPGYSHELKNARTYGVRLRENLLPVDIRQNKAGGLTLITQHRYTEDGQHLDADWVIYAIGQEKHARHLLPELQCDDSGRVMVNPVTNETSVAKVYAGGDCVNGGKEVVNAVADGRRAALTILKKIVHPTGEPQL